MKTLLFSLLFVAGSFVTGAEPSKSGSEVAATLIWNDEFNQPPGSTPDSARWNYDLGAGGWGNDELQSYTSSPENAAVAIDAEAEDGKALLLRALKQPDGSYTSARLKTSGKFATVYGRVEARLKMTNGKGIWPAFWMLGENVTSVGWPACGEIDVVEVINANPNKVHGTLHGPGYSGSAGITGTTTLPGGTLDQAYHVYAIDRTPDKIAWSFDGVVYHTVTPETLPPGTRWVFNDTPFFMILNLAVGGNWPGYPDGTTRFPQTFSIDYVRVYTLKTQHP
jgi:beta-glucanase (GH16 family)